MGTSISKILWYNNEKEVNASMVGYGSSGKTTILYKLLNDEVVNTLPTIGIYLILYIFIIFYFVILTFIIFLLYVFIYSFFMCLLKLLYI